MSKPLSAAIKRSLDSEFAGAEPRPDLWDSIREALPERPRRLARAPRWLTAAVATLAGVMITGIAFAFTPAGQAVMAQFGIRLAPAEEVQQKLAEKGVSVVTGKNVPATTANLREKVPADMRLPSYLPEGVREVSPKVSEYQGPWMVRWDHWPESGRYGTWTKEEAERFDQWVRTAPKVSVMWHPWAFGSKAQVSTHGEVTEVQEIKVQSIPAMAYHDDYGWNILVAIDGRQYQVITNISLEETRKVAESLK